jgi:hypothetical protein
MSHATNTRAFSAAGLPGVAAWSQTLVPSAGGTGAVLSQGGVTGTQIVSGTGASQPQIPVLNLRCLRGRRLALGSMGEPRPDPSQI